MTPVMPRSDAALFLRVSTRTVRRWGATGRLDERKIGPRTVRVTVESVERLLRAGAREEAA